MPCQRHSSLPFYEGQPQRPIILFTVNRSLTHEQFSSALNNLLKQLKIDSQCYNTHSFHIGAATSARQANIPDKYIKILGRWKGDAYLSYYIKIPPQELAQLSKCLPSDYPHSSSCI